MVDQGSDPGLREAAEQASEALTGCCDEGLVACIRARPPLRGHNRSRFTVWLRFR